MEAKAAPEVRRLCSGGAERGAKWLEEEAAGMETELEREPGMGAGGVGVGRSSRLASAEESRRPTGCVGGREEAEAGGGAVRAEDSSDRNVSRAEESV